MYTDRRHKGCRCMIQRQKDADVSEDTNDDNQANSCYRYVTRIKCLYGKLNSAFHRNGTLREQQECVKKKK